MPTVDPSFRYVWLIWASVFLLPWTALFVAWPALRRPMLWSSALTAPFGLTEFLFVPAYWNPPSLFDLAHRTGFDIESLIFCFGVLLMLPWNPIYPGIAALFVAALASGLCRPDLWRNTLVGGVVFLALYAVFLLGLKSLWPGYIEAVWSHGDLIAWRPAGLPLEELLFGFGFGMYWSSIYEHVTWRQRDALRESSLPTGSPQDD